MRENKVKKALKEGKVVIGTMVSEVRSPGIAQMLATAGFDFMVINSEHSSFSIQTVANLILAAKAADITSIVRVADWRQLFLPPDDNYFYRFFQENQWFYLSLHLHSLSFDSYVPLTKLKRAYQILLSTKRLSDLHLHSGNPLNGYLGSL